MMRIIKNVIISAVVIIVACLLGLSLLLLSLQESQKDNINRLMKEDQKIIVERIDRYILDNNRLPTSLSELGFEQTPILYIRDRNEFHVINCADNQYVIEYWDSMNDKIWQYVSEDRRWYDERIWEFEPPINMDTIRNINNITRLDRNKLTLNKGALMVNKDILPIYRYNIDEPDSLIEIPPFKQYHQYFKKDKIVMEGWIAVFSPSQGGIIKEFGEWKYYDKQGNCYRKFWNYKKGGVLIYEIDR